MRGGHGDDETSATKRKECTQPVFPQQEAAPHQRSDVNREQRVGEERTPGLELGGYGAAEISGRRIAPRTEVRGTAYAITQTSRMIPIGRTLASE